MSYAIGVDIGGSHVSCEAFDTRTGEPLEGTHFDNPVDCHSSSENIIKAWSSPIKLILDKINPESLKGIGIAMPGPFNYLEGISLFRGKNEKYKHTYGLNVEAELRKFLKLHETLTIRFINDAMDFCEFLPAPTQSSPSAKA
jgi:glucokinase